MKHLAIMIKPVSSFCNLNCKYCFYKDVSKNREIACYPKMDYSTATKIIDQAFASEASTIDFAFQGGEPTLAGDDFFESFFQYCEENKKSKEVFYSIQTNGYNLSNKLVKLFKKYNVLVGMSLDGLEKVHNKLRPIQNKDTYNKIIENINKLKENNIDFNILTVLSKQLEPYGKEVFEMFLKNNFEHIQIIECLAELNESSKDSAYACTPSVYKSFYTDFYKAWIDSLRNGKYVSVNTINDAVRVLSNQMPASCGRLGFLEYKMSLK